MLNSWFAGISDRRVIGLLVITILLAAVDFTQRVLPAVDESTTMSTQSASDMVFAGTDHVVSKRVQDWLASLAAIETSENAAGSVEAPQTELLQGGIDIGKKRVRVRAILIANATQQRIALIESQDREQRDVEFIELRQGDALAGYTVTAVAVDSVEFTANSGNEAPVRVKVFE
ncbi:hypothetical protein C9928_04080 [Pseudidiomarina aestuarii]|uniref:Uncharacterized protein n=1 Tax=Pseudidiomarina aestuarii TaxID=624146 RepID=A0A2T4D626_9GAMM|nr:hypothetical protein C9986_00355 [Pseudidiomarina aestuarii]PTB85128.1 hypothetical protein C9988_02435 [Pseudidiomarina aestuarii]PTB89259.1 hypothetical protein C9928_04080 [Pseudidiomarina aestuarii]